MELKRIVCNIQEEQIYSQLFLKDLDQTNKTNWLYWLL